MPCAAVNCFIRGEYGSITPLIAVSLKVGQYIALGVAWGRTGPIKLDKQRRGKGFTNLRTAGTSSRGARCWVLKAHRSDKKQGGECRDAGQRKGEDEVAAAELEGQPRH